MRTVRSSNRFGKPDPEVAQVRTFQPEQVTTNAAEHISATRLPPAATSELWGEHERSRTHPHPPEGVKIARMVVRYLCVHEPADVATSSSLLLSVFQRSMW